MQEILLREDAKGAGEKQHLINKRVAPRTNSGRSAPGNGRSQKQYSEEGKEVHEQVKESELLQGVINEQTKM